MRELILKYSGVEWRCRVSYDVIMHIENKVILTELATRIAQGAASGNVPNSHVVWCLFCLLKGAGAPIRVVDDVWEQVRDDKVDQETISLVLHFIIEEVFGSGPKQTLDADSDEPEKKTA